MSDKEVGMSVSLSPIYDPARQAS